MTPDDLVKYLTAQVIDNTNLDFVAFSRQYISWLIQQNRAPTAGDYLTALNALIRFVGFEKIPVVEITRDFIESFGQWLKDNPLKENSNMKRAPLKYVENLRGLHNAMKKKYNDEDKGIILIPNSPFRDLKDLDIPKRGKVKKRSLTVEQICKLIKLPDEQVKNSKGTNRYQIGKDCFLLSFYLMGTNSADLYDCTDYDNGWLTYERMKVRNRREDRAEISIEVPEDIMYLFKKYKDPSGKRTFRFHLDYANIKNFNKAINIGLKKVGKLIGVEDLEYYCARHTMATIARNRLGIDKNTVHEMLNHVDEKLKITDIYIERDYKQINDANGKLIEYIRKSLTLQ
jgi:site-specific recombinase XerD